MFFSSLLTRFSSSSLLTAVDKEKLRDDRKDNWTVSFSRVKENERTKEREREEKQRERSVEQSKVYVYSVDAAAERLCSSTTCFRYQFFYLSSQLGTKHLPYSFNHFIGIKQHSGKYSNSKRLNRCEK